LIFVFYKKGDYVKLQISQAILLNPKYKKSWKSIVCEESISKLMYTHEKHMRPLLYKNKYTWIRRKLL
jgi:hypothetical protein